MNTYYLKLNLPHNPLASDVSLTQLPVNRPGAGQVQPTVDISLLNQETLDAYASVGLVPERIFVLGNKSFVDDDPEFDVRCGAHRDMHWVDGKWQYQLFAINYELTPETHKVAWKYWDVSATPIFPEEPTTQESMWTAGQHFNAKQIGSTPNFGDPNDYTVIDKVILDRPTLCRIDVPHSAHHTNSLAQRYGLSVRFKHNFKTWEQVLTNLSPMAL